LSSRTLYDKVWNFHQVKELPGGSTQLFIGLHLIHEVTSPQAFSALNEKKLGVKFPNLTVATVDHIVPTSNQQRPFSDPLAEEMLATLEKNCKTHGIKFHGIGSNSQGVVHVMAPELGLTQPGMTVACGDSHTSTHGAFGAIAFGIGTSQVRDVLASQSLAMNKLKVRRIWVEGELQKGVYAKDLILHIIRHLGVKGGVGFAYEFAGPAIEKLSMEGRMTICNMAIEGGARCGYINPDETTFEYLKGKEYSPKGQEWDNAIKWWKSLVSDSEAKFDDEIQLDGSSIEPTVTWGITPGQGISIKEKIPNPEELPKNEQQIAKDACKYMNLEPDQPIEGTSIDVCFIGSCTNGRIEDLRAAAKMIDGGKVHENINAMVVPGSTLVKKQAEDEGLDKVFINAGFDWREAGCSMCLGMNPDILAPGERCASTSNRNYEGRQGVGGRTHLVSPQMAAAAAINGFFVDVRESN